MFSLNILNMLKKAISIDLSRARAFVLKKQLLNTTRKLRGKQGVMKIIDTLGYIQIDTINVIERSHHLVLLTRCPGYKQQFLYDLQVKDKKIFEYWAHAASFIPMKEFRYYIRKMKEKPKEDSWYGTWTKKYRHLLKKTKSRIEKEGPLAASDFKDTINRKRGPWWDWKPAKAALEILFWNGELMIKERRKFQRVYDLTERVLPKDIDTTLPSLDDEKVFFIKRALKAMGVATIQDINKYIGISGRLNQWVDQMQKKGEIVEVNINGVDKPYLALTTDLSDLRKKNVLLNSQVLFLSPFDNSIILRDRTSTLFDFDYTLEAYVPKSKRKYGYFCLPILWQDQLIGRIDPKADRQKQILIIKNLHLEDKKIDHNKFIPALSHAIEDLADFHNCEKIDLSKNIPSRIFHKITI